MKKKILGGIAVLATTVLAVINININLNTSKLPDVDIAGVEALAQVEWNDWTQWLSQGLTKDEREVQEQCPTDQSSSGNGSLSGGNGAVGGSASGSGSSSQTNPPGRTDIRCASGSDNCTPVKC